MYQHHLSIAIMTGVDTDHAKVDWFHKVKLSNLYKIGKNDIENQGKIGKIINKIGNNRNFHIVSIDPAQSRMKLAWIIHAVFYAFFPQS